MTSDLFQLRRSPLIPAESFPTTRYQGSKRKLVNVLSDVFQDLDFLDVLDLYSGTATVSLLLRSMGKRVHANDLLEFNTSAAFLFLNATNSFLSLGHHERVIRDLLCNMPIHHRCLVSDVYAGIFFLPEENLQIDRFCQNISVFRKLERSLYIYCVGQALLMKRPYNLFHRSNLVMRTRKVRRSFGNASTWEGSIADHAVKVFRNLRKFPFNEVTASPQVTCRNADDTDFFNDIYDVVYLDPPYLNGKSQPVDYCDFYHFLDGLIDYSNFSKSNLAYPHRPIFKARSPWMSLPRAKSHLSRVIHNFSSATFIMSYRSDGQPSAVELGDIFARQGRELKEAASAKYRYALSNSKETKESVLISPPANKMRRH